MERSKILPMSSPEGSGVTLHLKCSLYICIVNLWLLGTERWQEINSSTNRKYMINYQGKTFSVAHRTALKNIFYLLH